MDPWTRVPIPAVAADAPHSDLKDWFTYDWRALGSAPASSRPDPRPRIQPKSYELFELAAALVPGVSPLLPTYGLTMLAAGTLVITSQLGAGRFAGFVARRDEGVCHRIPVLRLGDPEGDGKACLIQAQEHYDRFMRGTTNGGHVDQALVVLATSSSSLMDRARVAALWRRDERWLGLVRMSPDGAHPYVGVLVAFTTHAAISAAHLAEITEAGRALFRSDIMDTRIVGVHVPSPPVTDVITSELAAVSLDEAMPDA